MFIILQFSTPLHSSKTSIIPARARRGRVILAPMPPSIQNSQINIPPDVIDLGLGAPPFTLLPLDIIARSAQVTFAQSDTSFLNYGAEYGDGYFRIALADFLAQGYGLPVDPERLFITNGISNGLDQICTLFTQPGDVIFVEEPTYFLALSIFRDHGLRVMAIDTDEHGLVPASLQDRLAEVRPKFIYTIPTFQNPTGRTLSQERREILMQLAREHNFLIVADEVYHLLAYTQRPPSPFAAYTDSQNIISLNSFSKILAPGLRLGWMQAHPVTLSRFAASGLLDSGGGLNPFTAALLRHLIESGDLQKNLDSLIAIYTERLAFMDACLQKHLPELTYTVPHGGYFFFPRLPNNMDATLLREKAAPFKVDFRQGEKFSSRGALKDYMRLCFAFYAQDQIEEGLTRLKSVLMR